MNGNKEEEHHGLLFAYYLEEQLTKMVKDDFEILEMKKYSEMATNDSFYIVLKTRWEYKSNRETKRQSDSR